MALAWLYLLDPSLLPEKHVNHGELIQPPVATPMKGSWTLLILQTEICDADCQRARTVASVVRRALGAEAYQRLDGPMDCTMQEMEAACAAVIGAVGVDATLVVIDPMGKAVMRYGAELKPNELFKDMQRLLSVSKYWGRDGAQ